MCWPKRRGIMGIQEFAIKNIALLSKSPNKLLSRILFVKLCRIQSNFSSHMETWVLPFLEKPLNPPYDNKEHINLLASVMRVLVDPTHRYKTVYSRVHLLPIPHPISSWKYTLEAIVKLLLYYFHVLN